MKLFVSELYDYKEGETYLMGVFSKSGNAIRAATQYIEEQGSDFRYSDWKTDALTQTFYFDDYILTITECELDKLN